MTDEATYTGWVWGGGGGGRGKGGEGEEVVLN